MVLSPPETLASLYRMEGDKLVLSPHPGQAAVLRSQARFILMLAGTQGGKTSFGPWWLWREIERKGKADYIAATSTYDLFKLKMLPEIRKVFEDILGVGRYWAGNRVIELCDPLTGKFSAKRQDDDMWGRIILRSAESPQGLESATAAAAWLDEVGMDNWDVTIWEAVLRRLAIHQGRALGTTTVYNSGWLKTIWYDRYINGDPDYDVIQFSSVLNPAFPQDEFNRAERTMAGWRFKMFYKGEFAKPEGLIYHDYDDDTMSVPDFQVPSEYQRIVGLDFGGANNAFIELACDARRFPFTWYAVREGLSGNKSTAEHVLEMRNRMAGCSNVLYTGGAPSESQIRRDWGHNGIHIRLPAKPELEVGISHVIALIKSGHFRVFKSCEGLRHELATYRRRYNSKDGSTTDVIEDKSTFHRLDALRYAASHVNVEIEVQPEVYVM